MVGAPGAGFCLSGGVARRTVVEFNLRLCCVPPVVHTAVSATSLALLGPHQPGWGSTILGPPQQPLNSSSCQPRFFFLRDPQSVVLRTLLFAFLPQTNIVFR